MQSNSGNNANSNGEGSANGNGNDTQNEFDEGNRFESIKTLAEGLFDLALLSSNANQLVHLMSNRRTSGNQQLRTATIILLIVSIILQVVVGGLLIALIAVERRRRVPERSSLIDSKQIASNPRRTLNTTATVLIFFITILNVLIPSLHPTAEQQDCENQNLSKMFQIQGGGYWGKRDHH